MTTKVGVACGTCSRCGKEICRQRPADMAVCDCWEYCQCTIYDLYATGLTILSSGSFNLEDDNSITIGDASHRVNSIHTMYLSVYDYLFSNLKFSPNNDVSIFIGKDEDGSLPAASEEFRGKLIRVEGGPGVANKLYCRMKKADDSYTWVQVASG